MSYLYGEQPRESKAALQAHLGACEECQRSIAHWQSAMSRLGKYKVPGRPVARAVSIAQPALKWAIAAALVLGAGVGIGRFSSPQIDPNALRAAVEQQVKSSLTTQLKQELKEELVADWNAVLTGEAGDAESDFRRELRAGLDRWTAKAAALSRNEQQRLFADFIDTYNAERQLEKRNTLALFDQAERRRLADNFKMRRSLETVALVADHKFKRTETELDQLASFAQSNLNLEDTDEPINPSNTSRN